MSGDTSDLRAYVVVSVNDNPYETRIVSFHHYERQAIQEAQEQVLCNCQVAYVYERKIKFWRVTADDRPQDLHGTTG